MLDNAADHLDLAAALATDNPALLAETDVLVRAVRGELKAARAVIDRNLAA